LLAESELWASDPTAAFEQVAEQFYRETGFLAPGKSIPLEMHLGADHDARRQQRYNEWHLQRRELRHNTLREAAAALRLPPDWRLIGADTPWPLGEVVKRLADAAEHLLRVHDCDTHGWEGIGQARDAAREYLRLLSVERPQILNVKPVQGDDGTRSYEQTVSRLLSVERPQEEKKDLQGLPGTTGQGNSLEPTPRRENKLLDELEKLRVAISRHHDVTYRLGALYAVDEIAGIMRRCAK
jgi:hypothetical protein